MSRAWLACAVALLLAACGGGDDRSGDDDGGTGGNGTGSSGSGELLQDPPTLVKSMTADHLLDGIDATVRDALLLQAGTPFCDIDVYKIQYRTVGGLDEPTDASGALMVPSGANDRCHGARPIVLYAHGTSTDRDFDLTNLDNQETPRDCTSRPISLRRATSSSRRTTPATTRPRSHITRISSPTSSRRT